LWLHSLKVAAQCGLFTHKSVPVIFEPPCIMLWSDSLIPSQRCGEWGAGWEVGVGWGDKAPFGYRLLFQPLGAMSVDNLYRNCTELAMQIVEHYSPTCSYTIPPVTSRFSQRWQACLKRACLLLRPRQNLNIAFDFLHICYFVALGYEIETQKRMRFPFLLLVS